MFVSLVKKIVGSKNERELKKMRKVVKQINELEESFSNLSDEELSAKTESFRQRLKDGETLKQILPEAFATVREASKRIMGMRHFDVQLMGGMALNDGNIAEMRTGEGKTLVATLPAYINALSGNGVHVITVNDYLARRDANWMRPLYEFLGLTVGVVVSGQSHEEKRAAYASDITYGTNNEYGFDYLRDNMALSGSDKVQRPLNFAIVDEVDSILIDEARTPLIISGPAQDSSELYRKINTLIPKLKPQIEEMEGGEEKVIEEGHYVVDEKQRSVELTEDGHEFVEELLIELGVLEEGDSLYSASNLMKLHHVHSALKAHVMFQRNVDYIVSNGQVVIVDEHTGRTMPGRRWGDGLHQAVEAKEGVNIQAESQTLASTTFQNYFRIYEKLSGMTGTADTEAYEFHQIYGLAVIVIPTNKDPMRKDANDLVYLTQEEKQDAIIGAIKEYQEKECPVLVGTASVDASELLSSRLKKEKIEHSVLNAKNHANEAQIIAEAGRPGVVTIATNMAGRGTDIVLGGNLEAELAAAGDISDSQKEKMKKEWEERHQKVLDVGGLHIIGTERHESRRIDNQLRGRAGRQGDPGYSQFFLSLDDGLMRIFASDGVRKFMQRLGMEKGEAIEHKMVNNAIEKAQRKVEGRNFDIRKQLLEYDDVANEQRKAIYSRRNELLSADDISDTVKGIRADVLAGVMSQYIPPGSIDQQWDIEGFEQALKTEFAIELPVQKWLDEDDKLHEETLRDRILQELETSYTSKAEAAGEDTLKQAEKQIMLQVSDALWKEHLATMDHLRQGIHLRGYAQKNPKQEYKRESFELFQGLLDDINVETTRILSHVQVRTDDPAAMEERRRQEAMAQEMELHHDDASALTSESSPEEQEAAAPAQETPYKRTDRKVGRNEACPCGSGKKYKQCCGKIS